MTQSKFITLADLIAQAESSCNQYALRFEKAYIPQDQNIETMSIINKCSKITAEILCKMSFGLFQIMGNNLISLGLSSNVFVYCNSIAAQEQMFSRYCIRNNCEYTLDDVINDESKRLDFARKYNGPGNVEAYAQRIIDIYSKGNNQ